MRHPSNPARWHREVEKFGRQTDGQQEERVEGSVVAVKLGCASRSGGSC